jgi:xanthine dehydrogenase YagS FAD-binding subunit
MRDVVYVRAQNLTQAMGALRERTNRMLLAGGTNVVHYIRTGGAFVADTLIDISHLPLRDVRVDQGGLTMGALARMSDVASHGSVKKAFPVVSQALELSAGPTPQYGDNRWKPDAAHPLRVLPRSRVCVQQTPAG